jgi:tRNA(fMet)-specific endonuclease VapC
VLVLDTDTLSIIQRRSGPEYGRLIARLRPEDEDRVHITIISIEEQMRGWLSFIARARSIEQQIESYARLHALLRDLRNRKVLDFDRSAADRYQGFVRSRVRVGTMDLRIAAIALARDAILLSRNLSDFRRVPDLRVEDWTTR